MKNKDWKKYIVPAMFVLFLLIWIASAVMAYEAGFQMGVHDVLTQFKENPYMCFDYLKVLGN